MLKILKMIELGQKIQYNISGIGLLSLKKQYHIESFENQYYISGMGCMLRKSIFYFRHGLQVLEINIVFQAWIACCENQYYISGMGCML
jgi:hypothetical protein